MAACGGLFFHHAAPPQRVATQSASPSVSEGLGWFLYFYGFLIVLYRTALYISPPE